VMLLCARSLYIHVVDHTCEFKKHSKINYLFITGVCMLLGCDHLQDLADLHTLII